MRAKKPCQWGRITLILVCALALHGCSTTDHNAPANPTSSQQESNSSASSSTSDWATPNASRPVFYDFQDIPVPSEMEMVPNSSLVFQSGSIKAGLITLKGRVELNSLINFFQAALPHENWKMRGGFRYRRSVIVFEKPDKTCVINIYDKMYYTYVEIYVVPSGGQM